MRLPPYERGITRHPLLHAPAGLRVEEHSIAVPPHAREAVAELVSDWEFKRRAGFETPAGRPDAEVTGMLATRVLGIRFVEPIRVIWADGRGFGYETRPGHPLYGEESFILGPDGRFSARSVSCPATRGWWVLGPLLRLMQGSTHRKYLRIVRDAVGRQGPPSQDG